MKKDNQGFSLVELIIVIAMMAVLVGLLAPTFLQYVEKARATTCSYNENVVIRQYKIDTIMYHLEDFPEYVDNNYGTKCPGGGIWIGKVVEGDYIIACNLHQPALCGLSFLELCSELFTHKYDTI